MTDALTTAQDYHAAWTSGDFARARALLAERLEVEVPVNDYPTVDAFGAALEAFGSSATDVRLLSALGGDGEATLLYDMDVPGLPTMRVAEHFTVSGGRIARLRQVHDTHALREAGFVGT